MSSPCVLLRRLSAQATRSANTCGSSARNCRHTRGTQYWHGNSAGLPGKSKYSLPEAAGKTKLRMACSADSSFLMDRIIGLLREIKMRDQSWGQQEIRSISKPFRRRVLHFNLSTFPFKMALTQKAQHFIFLEGRKDGRRNKKKGVYKRKTSNGIKLRCGVLFLGGFFR